MSGIFGIINKNGNPVEQAYAHSMQAALQHRAIHGSGIYHSNNVLIGHQAFITNIYQKNERLPYEDDTYVITSDARIDNRLDLANQLEYKKKYPSLHDSILILEAYKRWGEKCTDFLEGEFVFVIWNKQTSSLFAATDHMGFRSIFYYDSTDLFAFSSEIKGITAINATNKLFNEDSVVCHFRRDYNGSTYDKEIFELMPANHLFLEKSRPASVRKYWSVEAPGKYKFTKDQDWADCLKDLLIKAVEHRLHTEQNVGVLLSGGLDSSFVTVIAANILAKKNKPLYAFSSVLPENHEGPERDERYYINLLGKEFENIIQTFIYPEPTMGPFSDLEDTFNKYQTPPFQYHYLDKAVFSAVQQQNVSILLSGFGGDMTISNRGIDGIYELMMRGKLLKAYDYFNWQRSLGTLFGGVKPSLLQSIKAEILDNTLFFKHIYNPMRSLTRDEYALKNSLLMKISDKSSYGHPYRKDLKRQINTGVIGKFFCVLNSFSSHYATEYSGLMMDKALTEFFFDVPPEQFMLGKQRRSLLKRAMIDIVPEEIRKREDKKAYNPDFFSRFLSQEKQVESFLDNSIKTGIPFKFIDESKFIKIKEEIFSQKPGLLIPLQSLLLSQVILVETHTQWLMKQGYK